MTIQRHHRHLALSRRLRRPVVTGWIVGGAGGGLGPFPSGVGGGAGGGGGAAAHVILFLNTLLVLAPERRE